jgi:YHS domain-containing protein
MRYLVQAFAIAFALLVTVSLTATTAFAQRPPVYTGWFGKVAVGGYDTVSYFTVGRPVKGDARFKTEWQGAEFRFSSAANLAAFRKSPARYAPQYGGYCAWAVAHNYTAAGDPLAWTISGGKLYLNYNAAVQRDWLKDVPGYIAAGNRNWPGVLAR